MAGPLALQPNEWLNWTMALTGRTRAAVIGSAQTDLRSAHSDRQHVDLIAEAVTSALRGTGLRMTDVDFVIDSGSDFLDGRSISNCGFLGTMGANHKEESRVEEDGLWSAVYAASKILSGSGSVGLVVAYSKSSESDPRNYWSTLAEPFTQRPVGLDHNSAAGLYAQRYLHQYGIDPSALDAVSERAWSSATHNSQVDADVRMLDDSSWEETVAAPLRRRDMARPVDGAVAMLVASEHVARQIDRRPVWITGMGSAIDQHFLAAREPSSLPAAQAAAQAAFRMSGAKSAQDFDIVEVSAGSTVGELMLLEAFGLAEPGRAIELYGSGASAGLNPSGGTLPADVVMASGLIRLHEVASQLAGRSERPVEGAVRGLAHGSGGLGMQNHCVVTLETS